MPLARLLGIVLQHYYATLNESLHPLGLSAGQVPVILSLAACQNVTQEALARHFHVDKGAVARAARRLEVSGFIRREIDPADRRAVRLFLTEQGEQVVPELRRFGRRVGGRCHGRARRGRAGRVQVHPRPNGGGPCRWRSLP